MAELLLQAMEARQRGDITQTKQLLAQALVQNPHNEGAWMMMSEVVDDVKLKRTCLQRVLLINPKNEAASIALMRLDTSPLGSVVKGERYKPVVPPGTAKAPPYTPPFTWTEEDVEFQAFENMTYVNQTADKASRVSKLPATFDWAVDSEEPDKTIERIFETVSNPEKAALPLPDTDLSWLEEHPAGEAGPGLSDEEKEARLLDELVGISKKPSDQATEAVSDDFKVSSEPQLGMGAFAAGEDAETDLFEPEPLLWDNPKLRTDRLVILGSKSIIVASPAASDIPLIFGMFDQQKMSRELLGENAAPIKLENIIRLSTNPERSMLEIAYRQDERIATHQISFASPEVRDEALSALELRMGAGFARREQSFPLNDKILPPLLSLLVIALIGWVIIGGFPLLSRLQIFQSGVLQLILTNLQNFVNAFGAFNLLLIDVILILLCLLWLVVNLSKPTRLLIIEKL
ncbi:MAG: hypothetical protein C3F13_18015 [Anaerolineales bacterium]|nr:hypothetical protein [Anaerolineae bacterium]PWB49734.1 MAG: hypothetical protein C3F13_18015 [Anaerolineales bacterium]